MQPNRLKKIFYGYFLRPLLVLLLGFNARHIDRLKYRGAHLVAANHNSHLDALVLMSLFCLRDIEKVKVVAAKDYFCRTPFTTWLTLNVIGAIPIDRDGSSGNPLAPVLEALDQNYTVVIFPEGSRGEPETRQPLKYGVAKILELRPDITITPVFIHGLGKSLPRGEGLLVPFVCDVNVGEPLSWNGNKTDLIERLDNSFTSLAEEISVKEWI